MEYVCNTWKLYYIVFAHRCFSNHNKKYTIACVQICITQNSWKQLLTERLWATITVMHKANIINPIWLGLFAKLKAAVHRCSYKNLAIFTGKPLCWSPFLEEWRPTTLLKRVSDTGVSCQIWEIFKNTFLKRSPPAAASVYTQSKHHPAQFSVTFVYTFKKVLALWY